MICDNPKFIKLANKNVKAGSEKCHVLFESTFR